MTKPSSRSPYRDSSEPSLNLTQRVRDRVSAAEMKLASLSDPDDKLELHALWEVFNHFGDARREQRRQTGEKALPGLRDATRAFRRSPSLSTLVTVAGYLDERGLLTPVN
jgi:hypothetical protein